MIGLIFSPSLIVGIIILRKFDFKSIKECLYGFVFVPAWTLFIGILICNLFGLLLLLLPSLTYINEKIGISFLFLSGVFMIILGYVQKAKLKNWYAKYYYIA